jgi:hypothetical protein
MSAAAQFLLSWSCIVKYLAAKRRRGRRSAHAPIINPAVENLTFALICRSASTLGAKIAVPTLSGKVQVTIPPHSSSGCVRRLKGKGLSKASGHGDLLVTPRIVLPEGADALMRKWREGGKGSVRGWE